MRLVEKRRERERERKEDFGTLGVRRPWSEARVGWMGSRLQLRYLG